MVSLDHPRSLGIVLAAAVVRAVGACGEQADNAVEAIEQNAVELGGIDYRVVRFRQLNPRITPDRAIVGTLPPPARGRAYYAAFLTACNRGGKTRTPTSRIHLEDAFGRRFPPLDGPRDGVLVYRVRPLRPGGCLPVEDGPAEKTVGGAAVLFDVQVEAARERPLILELARRPRGRGRPAARIQLDL